MIPTTSLLRSRLRQYANEEEALLIFDEVQTGFYGSGTAWLWQQHGVAPDVVAFGKKSQVCGVYANDRVDEIEDNAFNNCQNLLTVDTHNGIRRIGNSAFYECKSLRLINLKSIRRIGRSAL